MVDKKNKKTAAAGKVWVSRQFMKSGAPNSDKPEVADQHLLEVRCFEVEPAYVRAGYGLTINLGNYESARCDAGVTLPCYVEEVPEAFKEAWAMAEEQVQAQVKEIKK